MPPRYGHGEISQRRSFGTAISQIRIAGPKNSAVYFDNSAAPTATPTASHHAPRPVARTFARQNSTKLEATSSGASGVTIMVPTAAISVTLSRMVAVAATRLAAEQNLRAAIHRKTHRQRQQDRHQPHAEFGIARDQRAEPDQDRDHRRMVVIAAGEMFRPGPVIGFVEGQRRVRRGDQPQRDQCQNGESRFADQPRWRSWCDHRLRQTNRPDMA